MIQNDIDVFRHYDLPFETYFNKQIAHQVQIHDELELIWVLRGNLELTCEGEQFLLTRQTLFMMNPYYTHTIQSSEDAMIITYRFKKDYLDKLDHSFEGLVFEKKVHKFDDLASKYKEVPLLITQLLKILIDPNPSQFVRYKIMGYYNMFIYELYNMLLKEKYLDVKKKNVSTYLDRINKITEYLNRNFLHKVTLEDLALHIGISRYRLSHFVKEQIGISFREYIFNMRLEYALRLLRESDMSVLEIADKAGYSDVKYLNSMIKERFNQTALKYRKSMKDKLRKMQNRNSVQEFFEELRICINKIEQAAI